MTTPRFHRLAVRDVRRETPDAVSVAFTVPDALAADYAFQAGQYLTIRTTMEGEELRRSYSICAGPDEEMRVAVKRVPGGVFSSWVNEELAPGQELDVMTPTGRFGVGHRPEEARIHVGFAAGSGITPILSIIRGILAREPLSRVFLFYGNRSMADMLFRTELEELKDRYLQRLSVFHVLSKEEQDVPVLNGRLDRAKARLLLTHIVPAASIDHLFICGPTGMSEDVEAAAGDLGIPAERVHVERFVSEFGGRPRPRPAPPAPDAPGRKAALIVDGNRREVTVTEGETVLDAALRAGMDLPFACRGGMCSTCRAKVVEGEVRMDLNYSLEPWETQAGFVLTCQAHPVSESIVIDYDQV